jgi:hypothetical protein
MDTLAPPIHKKYSLYQPKVNFTEAKRALTQSSRKKAENFKSALLARHDFTYRSKRRNGAFDEPPHRMPTE